MRTRTLWLAAAACAALSAGCAGEPSAGSPADAVTDSGDAGPLFDSSGGDGSGDDTSVDSAGGGDSTGDDTGSDAGDDTTVEPGDPGVSGGALVSGGGISASPKYTLLHTIGAPSANQIQAKSPSYRLQGGLIGIIGGTP